jgi:HAD superfamily hydrolase (TIGR01458 family)
MNLRANIPVLIDFDGIIKIGEDISPYAKKFLNFVEENKIPSIIISNSTLRTSSDIRSYLTNKNAPTKIPIITAVDATLHYVKKHYKKISVYSIPPVKKYFKEFENDNSPQAVVIGDLGEEWNYDIMNEIFRKVMNGADIIAMQKNKYWKPGGTELSLDAGAFISAIEYAANKEAILIGKPSPLFFQSAIEAIGFKEKFPFIMIGDDLDSDIYAAQNIGGIGILVYTGKTSSPLPSNLRFKPDYESENLLDVMELLTPKTDVNII